jgi:threonine/homoserine/homoserine lactone efflux protein
VSIERWVAFVGVLLVVLCTPGPDFAVVLRHALAGPRRGVRAAAGIVTGLAVHTTVAALGLSAVVAARPDVLTAIRWAGAAYLLLLGVQGVRAALRRGPEVPAASTPAGSIPAPIPAAPTPVGRPFVDGLVGNLLNPKALLFFLGLIPQFLDHDHAAGGQILLLAGTTVAAAVLWWTLVIAAAARGRAALRHRKTRRVVDAVTGTALVGVALGVITT